MSDFGERMRIHYACERFGEEGRGWRVSAPDGSLVLDAFDGEKAVLAAWMHAHGGGVPPKWSWWDETFSLAVGS